MDDEKVLSGVEEEEAPDAGEQEEEDLFSTGDEDEAEGEEQASEAEETEEKVDPKAFAAKLAKEREKIEQETKERLEKELRQEYDQKYGRTQEQGSQQQSQQQGPPPLPRDQLEKLADDLGMTPEAANAMYIQQWRINQQNNSLKKQEEYLKSLQDNTAKGETLRRIEEKRQQNPNLPEADTNQLEKIRKDYKYKTGYDLPWDDAYDKLVAQEAMSGNLERSAQQKVINNITSRGKATVQAGKGGQAKKPSIEDMSKEEFDSLVEQAKAGKFKKG